MLMASLSFKENNYIIINTMAESPHRAYRIIVDLTWLEFPVCWSHKGPNIVLDKKILVFVYIDFVESSFCGHDMGFERIKMAGFQFL